jgi:hypothetical protein
MKDEQDSATPSSLILACEQTTLPKGWERRSLRGLKLRAGATGLARLRWPGWFLIR